MRVWRPRRSGRAEQVSDRVWELGGHGFDGHRCNIACPWWQRGLPKRWTRAQRTGDSYVVYVPGVEAETTTACRDYATALDVARRLMPGARILHPGAPIPGAVRPHVLPLEEASLREAFRTTLGGGS